MLFRSSDPLDARATGATPDRATLAVAPFLSELADDPDAPGARPVPFRRTLDRLTWPDGATALQWTEVLRNGGEPPPG